jgi:WD40 repeat protein
MTQAATRAGIRSPWKGLAPFDDSDQDAFLFFGRDREIDVACANLTASRLTVLFGASGVGKSSLLRAGVVRRLRDEDGGESVVALVASWAGDPVATVADAARRAVETELGVPVADPGGTLADRLRAWTEAFGGELYLVLDQVEEYFLYHGDDDGPGSFAAEFPALVTEQGLRVHVLLGIREDGLGLLDAFRAAVPGVLSNYLRLERLDRASGRLAILGPIARWNELEPTDAMTAEPAFVEAVLDEVAAGRIEPEGMIGGVTATALVERIEAPYLQLVLERVWEAERADGSSVLRRETLRQHGGAARIVEDHVGRALSALTDGERLAAAALFAYLVTPSGTKIAHTVDDLASYSGLPRPQTQELVASLERERILRPADGERVEIYHDVLAAAVGDWRRRHEAAEAVARERRRHRRLLAVLVGALIALAVVVGVALYALQQRNEAQASAARAEQQAALARAGFQEARKQEGIAIDRAEEAAASKQDAEQQAAAAERSAQEAQTAQAQAEASQAAAEQSQTAAEASQADAEASEADAQQQAAAAEAARQDASEQATAAEQARGVAAQQARRAEAQTKVARANAELRREQADVSRTRELAARALAMLDDDPFESVQMALRAAAIRADLPVVESVLRRTLIELRLRTILRGGSSLNDATFSPDGSLVATAGNGGQSRIFRTATGELLHRLPQSRGVLDTAFSPDGRILATAGRNRMVLLWDVATGTILRTLPHGGAVISVDFSRDGRMLATGADDRIARLWDVATGLELHQVPHPFTVRQALISPDGRFLATHTSEALVRVFDTGSGSPAATLQQAGEVTTIAWSPAGSVLGSAGRRNGYLWSTTTWRQQALLEGHTAPIRAMVFGPDGTRVVTSSVDSSSRLYRVSTGDLLFSINSQSHEVTSAAFSPDGSDIVTGSLDRTAGIWSQQTARNVAFVGHRDAVIAVAYSPDGTRVLTASHDGTARLWEPTGEPVLPEVARHEGGATSASFSPDGRSILSSGADGTAQIRRLSGGPVVTLRHAGPVTRASWVAGGRLVLTASADGTARMWRPTGATVAMFEHGATVVWAAANAGASLVATAGDDGAIRLWRGDGSGLRTMRHGDDVMVVKFAPDGRRLLSASVDGTAAIWRVSDGARLHVLPSADAVVAAAWSPRGERVVTGSADAIGRVWDAATGRLVRSLIGHAATVTSAAFSRDGRTVLTADRVGDARTWNAATGRSINTFRGHVSTIAEARFSPDGRWVITAGPLAGGLWEADTGKLLFFLRGHTAPLTSASFSPDGRWILTSGVDGTVRTWQCVICADVKTLVRVARARVAAVRASDD